MKSSHQTVLAFAASALAGLALRSHDCFFVDGAARCLAVFQRPVLQFHPNNHLLYPVDVLVWTRMAGALGLRLSDPLCFVIAVDTMNVLAAAICVTVLFRILLRVTSDWKLSAAVCAGYGLTTAFLAQATNPNEPMVGAAWSFLGVAFAILSLRNHRVWPVVVSGLLFALAMATYRSMVLVAPAAAVIIASSTSAKKLTRGEQLLRLTVLGAAFIAGCAVIFGWAYSHIGVGRADMVAKFLHEDDTSAYFDPSPTQWLKLPLGLVRNCFPVVTFYNGMWGFLARPKRELIAIGALVGAVWFCLFYCGYILAKRRASWIPAERTAVVASLAGLLCTLIPLVTWNPHYGKFWIQPLACLAVLVAVSFRHLSQVSRKALMVWRIAGALFLAGVAFNLGWAVRNRTHVPFEFEEARKVTQIVGPKDFVVLDRGADSVSVMYAYLWADESEYLPIMDVATVKGKGMLKDVEDAIRRTQAAGGKVYFLGVVDLPKPTWEAFLGRRCGVPYETFDRYRSAVRLRAQFRSRTGPASLWELTEPQAVEPANSVQQPRS